MLEKIGITFARAVKLLFASCILDSQWSNEKGNALFQFCCRM